MQNWKTRDFTKVLSTNGYVYKRSHGDHDLYVKPRCGTIAITAKTINGLIAKSLIRQYRLEVPEKLQERYVC